MKNVMTKRLAVPLWGLVAGGFAVLVIGVVAGSSGTGSTELGAATTTTTERSSTTLRPTSTIRTSTTAATTTTTAAPTPDQQKAAVIAAIDSIRTEVASNLEANLGPATVRSVDQIGFDPNVDALVLGITSEYSTDDYVSRAAWDITSALIEIWREVTLPAYSPGLHLTVNQTRFRCPGEFMRQLADRRASEGNWRTSCR